MSASFVMMVLLLGIKCIDRLSRKHQKFESIDSTAHKTLAAIFIPDSCSLIPSLYWPFFPRYIYRTTDLHSLPQRDPRSQIPVPCSMLPLRSFVPLWSMIPLCSLLMDGDILPIEFLSSLSLSQFLISLPYCTTYGSRHQYESFIIVK